MNKKIFVLIIFIVKFGLLEAQTTTDFLKTIGRDERILGNKNVAAWLETARYHAPLLKKIELRLGVNGSAFRDTIYGDIRNEDFYGLVITPNNLREIEAQKGVQSAQLDVLRAQGRVWAHTALVERYQNLADLLFLPNLLTERQNLDTILQKKQRILEKTIENGLDIKVKDVMDTENDRTGLAISLVEIENQLRLARQKMVQLTGFEVSKNAKSEISVQQILKNTSEIALRGFANTPPRNVLPHPTVPLRVAEAQLAQSQLNLEQKQSRGIFNFFQIAYENPIFQLPLPDKQRANNNFSVRMGLTYPIPANNNFKVAEATLQQRQANENIAQTAAQNYRSIETQRQKIENLAKTHAFCQKQLSESLIQKMLNNPNLMAQISPLEIVELELTLKKLQLKIAEIEREIAVEYVRLLDLTGVASLAPLKNYFSPKLEPFFID